MRFQQARYVSTCFNLISFQIAILKNPQNARESNLRGLETAKRRHAMLQTAKGSTVPVALAIID